MMRRMRIAALTVAMMAALFCRAAAADVCATSAEFLRLDYAARAKEIKRLSPGMNSGSLGRDDRVSLGWNLLMDNRMAEAKKVFDSVTGQKNCLPAIEGAMYADLLNADFKAVASALADIVRLTTNEKLKSYYIGLMEDTLSHVDSDAMRRKMFTLLKTIKPGTAGDKLYYILKRNFYWDSKFMSDLDGIYAPAAKPVASYLAAGNFYLHGGVSDMDTAFGPEKSLKGPYDTYYGAQDWIKVYANANDGAVANVMKSTWNETDAVYYLTYVKSTNGKQRARLRVNSAMNYKLFVNGRVAATRDYRKGAGAFERVVEFTAEEQPTAVTLKLIPHAWKEDAWGFRMFVEGKVEAGATLSAANGEGGKISVVEVKEAAEPTGDLLKTIRAMSDVSGTGDEEAADALALRWSKTYGGSLLFRIAELDSAYGDSNEPDEHRVVLARAAAEKALKIMPECPLVLQFMGFYYLKKDQMDEAEKIFLKLEEISGGKNGDYYFGLAMAYARKEMIPQAWKHLKRASEMLPNSFGVMNQLAMMEVRRGDYEGAAAAAWKSATALPFSASNRVNAVRILARIGRDDEAARLAMDTQMRFGPSAELQMEIGKAHFRAGRVEEARHAYDQAIGIDPRSAGAYLERAGIHDALGHGAEAEADYTTYAEHESGFRVRNTLRERRGETRSILAMNDAAPACPKAETAADAGKTDARYLMRKTIDRIGSTTDIERLTINRIRILTNDGAQKFGDFEIPTSAELLEARIVAPDGSVSYSEFIQSKENSTVVSMSGIQNGSTLEFSYVKPMYESLWKLRKFELDGEYLDAFETPSDETFYGIAYPKDYGVKTTVTTPGAGERSAESVDLENGMRFAYGRSCDTKTKIPEANMPSGKYMIPYVSALSVEREDVARSMAGAVETRSRPTPRVADIARSLAAKSKSKRESARLIYEYVVKKIADDYERESEDATLILGKGDTESRTYLLMSMLNAVGIRSEFVLSSAWSEPELKGPNVFTYYYSEPLLIVYTDEGAPMWMDASNAYVDPGTVSASLSDRPALVIAKGGGRAARTPKTTKTSDVSHNITHCDVAVSGDGTCHVRFVTVGSFGMLRSAFKDPTERTQLMQQLSNYFYPGSKVKASKFEHIDDLKGPFAIDTTLSAPKLLTKTNGSRQRFIRVPKPPNGLAKMMRSGKDRVWPVAVEFPISVTHAMKLRLPKGTKVASLPSAMEIKEEFCDYSYRVDEAKGEIVANVSLFIPVGVYPAAKFDEMMRAFKSVDAKESEKIIVETPAKSDGK